MVFNQNVNAYKGISMLKRLVVVQVGKGFTTKLSLDIQIKMTNRKLSQLCKLVIRRIINIKGKSNKL